MNYGRYWVRTSDLFRVKEARYPCANRPWSYDNSMLIHTSAECGGGENAETMSSKSHPYPASWIRRVLANISVRVRHALGCLQVSLNHSLKFRFANLCTLAQITGRVKKDHAVQAFERQHLK